MAYFLKKHHKKPTFRAGLLHPDPTLAARILIEEHKIYPEAVRLYFDGRLEVRGRRVSIRD